MPPWNHAFKSGREKTHEKACFFTGAAAVAALEALDGIPGAEVPMTVSATAATATTTTTGKNITLGYAALHNADTENAKWDYVYFGTYNNNPIKWRVLSTNGSSTTTDTATYKTAAGTAYNGNALFMLSENTLFDTQFCRTTGDNAWLTSNLRSKMQDDIFGDDSNELKYVLKTTKTDRSETIGYIDPYDNNSSYSIKWGVSNLSDDTLFALSAKEVEQYLGSGEKYANRKSGDAAWWWLRSPDAIDTDVAGVVDNDGLVFSYGLDIDIGARPALNLNLSSVLFTSAAVGGKSSNAAAGGVAENSNFSDIKGNDGYKLTLLDESRSSFSACLKSVSGNTATVSYSGAKTGTNEYISVIIKNGDNVKYYGRVAAASAASADVTFTLPSDFSTANGDVLCVFNEQYNGDKNSDYASNLMDVLFDYTVNFNANGATGTMASQTMTYGIASSLSENTFTRNGYTFNGWNTKANGNGTAYSDKQSATNLVTDASTPTVTLYAQWTDTTDPVISGITNGETYCESQTVTVSDNDGIASVTVNGTPVTPDNKGKLTLSPAKGEQKIIVTDKAGNKTEMTVTVNDGHTYEWKTENEQYWQKCKFCGDETDKKDIPEITINGADKVCVTQGYSFTVTVPEGASDVTYGYEFANKGNSGIEINPVGGIYSATLTSNMLENESSFILSAVAITADGYTVSTSKTVQILSEHTGGTATCTEKAKCEVCGEEYGEVDADNHTTLKHIEAKAATTETEGNTEYWHCEDCGKYFSDKNGKNEIALADTVVAKLEADSTPKAPKTGDEAMPMLWLALAAMSALGVAIVAKKKAR